MYCPKCGKPLGAGAAFCMHCGARLSAPQAMTPPAMQPQAVPAGQGPAPAFPTAKTSSKKTTWIAIGTALAMILALFFGLNATGLLQFGAKNPKINSLRAQGSMPKQDLLRAEGSSSPPVLSQSAQRVEMPADVRRWLEHLEAKE